MRQISHIFYHIYAGFIFLTKKQMVNKYNQMKCNKLVSVQIISTTLPESWTTSVHDVLTLFLEGASKYPSYEMLEELTRRDIITWSSASMRLNL